MRRAVAAVLVSTLLLTFCQTAPVRAAASWNVQTVDSNAAMYGNGYCTIAVDSNNVPSIAYTGYNMQDSFSVMYARWNSSLGGFSTQRIAIGDATDMALDANNSPHILYEVIRAGFRYASWTGSNWSIQTVDTAGSVYAALALDSAGHPHAAYSTGTALKYASRSGSNWTTETVDNGTDIPFQLSLASDSNDKPYILYSNQGLKLTTLENSGWNIQNVTLPDTIKGVGNMVLDSKGHPHLIYSVGSVDHGTIKYASWNGVAWKTQTVASDFRLESIWSIGFLALDHLDYPHIYCISGGIYAVWTGLYWNIQHVDAVSGPNPVYMAVDSNRIPHVSYRVGNINDPTYSLMYATASEPVPLASPLPLLLVLAAVIGALALLLYLKTRKR